MWQSLTRGDGEYLAARTFCVWVAIPISRLQASSSIRHGKIHRFRCCDTARDSRTLWYSWPNAPFFSPTYERLLVVPHSYGFPIRSSENRRVALLHHVFAWQPWRTTRHSKRWLRLILRRWALPAVLHKNLFVNYDAMVSLFDCFLEHYALATTSASRHGGHDETPVAFR